jgi:antirestriction protein
MKTPCVPRIYVACLASYNAGILHGRWIDCDQEVDGIRREIAEMLATSNEPIAEEYAIHDYENFGAVRLHEYEDIERVAEIAKLIGEHRDMITHIVEHCGGLEHLEEAKRLMDEEYSGEWNSLADWAEDFLDETGQLESIPESLRYYLDFEKYAADCELSGDIFTIEVDGKVHVFWNR